MKSTLIALIAFAMGVVVTAVMCQRIEGRDHAQIVFYQNRLSQAEAESRASQRAAVAAHNQLLEAVGDLSRARGQMETDYTAKLMASHDREAITERLSACEEGTKMLAAQQAHGTASPESNPVITALIKAVLR